MPEWRSYYFDPDDYIDPDRPHVAAAFARWDVAARAKLKADQIAHLTAPSTPVLQYMDAPDADAIAAWVNIYADVDSAPPPPDT